MAVKIHGQHDLVFEFWQRDSRDEAIRRINTLRKTVSDPGSDQSRPTSPLVESPTVMSDISSNPMLSKNSHATDVLTPPREMLFQSMAFPDQAISYMPFVANRPWPSASHLKPRHFVCLTIGSRGDVQPYIALGLRLKQDGHRVTIVTHCESVIEIRY